MKFEPEYTPVEQPKDIILIMNEHGDYVEREVPNDVGDN